MYHIELLKAQGVQGSQAREVSYVPVSYASLPRISGSALTAWDGERIMLCGGIMPMGPRIGVLWALLSADAGTHMLWLHRATKRFIEINPPKRLEASVEKGFPQGCRWLELLGFRFEGEMSAYGLNGETHLRYART